MRDRQVRETDRWDEDRTGEKGRQVRETDRCERQTGVRDRQVGGTGQVREADR